MKRESETQVNSIGEIKKRAAKAFNDSDCRSNALQEIFAIASRAIRLKEEKNCIKSRVIF
jgi:hypothetical protein